MAETEREPARASAPLAVVHLRRLWESGQRADCLRAALAQWEQLLGDAGELRWLEAALRSSGLTAEAFALRWHEVRRHGDVRGREAFVRSVLQSGDPWWAAELLHEGPRGVRELDELAIEAQLAVGDAADLIADWQRTYRDNAACEAAVQWWVRCGRIAEAERVVESTPSLAVWRARLAIWRNQPAAASVLLDALPTSPAVRCLRAIAELQQGRAAEAEALLRTLLDTDAQAEAWIWLTTALRKQGRYAEAGRAAEVATSMSPAFNLVLWMERILAAEYQRLAGSQPAKRSRLRSFLGRFSAQSSSRLPRIGELEHAWALYPLGVRPDDPESVLESLIERFGGNHSADLSITDGQTLSSYPLPPDAGQLGVRVQLVLRTRGVDSARALYRELAPRANGPRFSLYQGETELWMGAYADAARIFRAILDEHPEIKWAWIGLGASAMLQGELVAAQEIWQQGLISAGTPGPTLSVYRGECYRRQGEPEAARRELELAVRQRPQRLSAWINLALLNREADLLARVERECVEQMPILMGELAGDAVARLAGVLDAMRGNRGSSRVTYHLWGHVWHFMTRVFAAPEWEPSSRPGA